MIESTKITIAQLLDGLNLRGVALLPRALPPTRAADFRTRAEALAELWRRKDQAGRLDQEDQFSLKVGTVHFLALMGDPVGRAFVLDLFAALADGPAWRLFRRLFGDEVAFPLRLCTIRWHAPPFEDTPVPLHQDVGFIGPAFPVVNCWLTFTRAGGDAAGLEIEPVKLASELPKHGDPRRAANINFWSIEIDPQAAAERLTSAERLRPLLDPGDAVLFDQFTPHRTWAEPSMTEPRVSVELRGCRAAHHGPDHKFPDKLILTATADGVAARTILGEELLNLGPLGPDLNNR
jgi:hypothetical protein